MDLECGDIIYAEATVHGTVELRTIDKNESGLNALTPDEARTLAEALVRAADEAEPYRPEHDEECVTLCPIPPSQKCHVGHGCARCAAEGREQVADVRTAERVVQIANERGSLSLGTVGVGEFARRMGVNPATVRLWLKDGQVRGIKLSDTQQGRWLIPISELGRLGG
jgi:hypothetical protein